MTTNVKIGNKI